MTGWIQHFVVRHTHGLSELEETWRIVQLSSFTYEKLNTSIYEWAQCQMSEKPGLEFESPDVKFLLHQLIFL